MQFQPNKHPATKLLMQLLNYGRKLILLLLQKREHIVLLLLSVLHRLTTHDFMASLSSILKQSTYSESVESKSDTLATSFFVGSDKLYKHSLSKSTLRRIFAICS